MSTFILTPATLKLLNGRCQHLRRVRTGKQLTDLKQLQEESCHDTSKIRWTAPQPARNRARPGAAFPLADGNISIGCFCGFGRSFPYSPCSCCAAERSLSPRDHGPRRRNGAAARYLLYLPAVLKSGECV